MIAFNYSKRFLRRYELSLFEGKNRMGVTEGVLSCSCGYTVQGLRRNNCTGTWKAIRRSQRFKATSSNAIIKQYL